MELDGGEWSWRFGKGAYWRRAFERKVREQLGAGQGKTGWLVGLSEDMASAVGVVSVSGMVLLEKSPWASGVAGMSLSIRGAEVLSGNAEVAGTASWENMAASGDGTGFSTLAAGKDHVYNSAGKSKLC